MATPSEIQAAADPADTMNVIRIHQSTIIDATYDAHYTVGLAHPYSGKSKWCQKTKADSAADQATELLVALVL